ncbi:kinetochore protein NDC80 homolog [Lycorma delicatula]|uniref:kinetochore protein NDC80 homolog n=1 Tax=Lycorma delicatula TaxID=130591 RepID=UPI003F517E36
MRKSSLGRRSSVVSSGAVESANQDSTKKPEKKSLLLQPGFSQCKKRTSSEDRLSSLRNPPQFPQSMSRSRSEMSLLAMTPCTPMIFRQRSVLPSGSIRPSRSEISSMDSNRFSSIGGLKSTKKETRPVNDKQFQIEALMKVQDFFQKQPNCFQILDNSMNVRPMTLKKFINITGYLFSFIDEKIILTKDNYIDMIIKAAKQLMYGGKMDKSWLVVVNAPHAWCHTISFLVWLVDLVYIFEQGRDSDDLLYPQLICDEAQIDVLEDNFRCIQPYLVDNYQFYLQQPNTDLEAEFDKRDDMLITNLLQKQDLLEKDFQGLLEDEEKMKATIDNAEYRAEEMKMQSQENDLQDLRKGHAELKEYIVKQKSCLEARMHEINQEKRNVKELLRKIKEKTAERDEFRKTVDEMKCNKTKKNESINRRKELQGILSYNEKCIAKLSESIYQLDINAAKNLKKMEVPLIDYHNLLAINTKNEPRLKSCVVENMCSLLRPDVRESIAEADKLLQSIRNDWIKIHNDQKTVLQQLEQQNIVLIEQVLKYTDDLQKKKKQLQDISHKKSQFLDCKDKDLRTLQNAIRSFEENTKISMEKVIILNTETRDKLKARYEAQVAELKEVMELAELYFKRTRQVRDSMHEESLNIIRSVAAEIGKHLNEGKDKK